MWVVVFLFSLSPTISHIFCLSVGDGSMKTEIPSRRAVKHKAGNQSIEVKILFAGRR